MVAPHQQSNTTCLPFEKQGKEGGVRATVPSPEYSEKRAWAVSKEMVRVMCQDQR